MYHKAIHIYAAGICNVSSLGVLYLCGNVLVRLLHIVFLRLVIFVVSVRELAGAREREGVPTQKWLTKHALVLEIEACGFAQCPVSLICPSSFP